MHFPLFFLEFEMHQTLAVAWVPRPSLVGIAPRAMGCTSEFGCLVSFFAVGGCVLRRGYVSLGGFFSVDELRVEGGAALLLLV